MVMWNKCTESAPEIHERTRGGGTTASTCGVSWRLTLITFVVSKRCHENPCIFYWALLIQYFFLQINWEAWKILLDRIMKRFNLVGGRCDGNRMPAYLPSKILPIPKRKKGNFTVEKHGGYHIDKEIRV